MLVTALVKTGLLPAYPLIAHWLLPPTVALSVQGLAQPGGLPNRCSLSASAQLTSDTVPELKKLVP